MVSNVKKFDYAWDSMGYASELMVINIDLSNEEAELSEIGKLRVLSGVIEGVKYDNKVQNSVHSAYDCTGQAFGSNFEIIDWRYTEYGFIATLIHSWSLDI